MGTSSTTKISRTRGQTSKTQWFFSDEIRTDIYLLPSCGKDNLRKFQLNLDGKSATTMGMLVCLPKTGQLLQIWTCCKKNVLMTFGLWTRIQFVRPMERYHEEYSIERKTSQRICVVWGEIDKRFTRLPDQIMYGQKYGQTLVKPLRREENRNGQTRSQNLTMFGN